jgi:putrescine transport system substrate-binding protein
MSLGGSLMSLKSVVTLAGLALACTTVFAQEEEKILNIYNW